MDNILSIERLSVVLDKKEIIKNISFGIPKGKITAIIGPNGCGKSTTLKAIARILPFNGTITFKNRPLQTFSQKQFARCLAILTQSPLAPVDFTVYDLVNMGRFPYKSLMGRMTKEDKEQVLWALEQTSLYSFRHRLLGNLSGGERQRAWIAMALAQQPEVLLLDEPTTYLDICHQIEVMKLLQQLNETLGLTVVMVIHDLNQALQYAQHVIVIKQGKVVQEGKTEEVINERLLAEVYGVKAEEFVSKEGLRILAPLELLEKEL